MAMDKDSNKLKDLVLPVYGDTDSILDTYIRCNIENTQQNIKLSELFEMNRVNGIQLTQNNSEVIKINNIDILNYSDDGKLVYSPIAYIMRHKVSKLKWRLKTKTGKEVIVTDDHSLIVFRDGKKLEVKAKDVLCTDKILIVDG